MAGRLPSINAVGYGAPFRWMALGWRDLCRAPGPLLVHGLVVAALSFAIAYEVYATNAAFWALAFTFGYVFVAPVIAMGPYEAGRRLTAGERVTLGGITLVRPALRQDVAYLGLALLLIYLLWGRVAQIVYGLSTWTMQHTIPDFLAWAVGTAEGHAMLLTGSIVGGAFAYLTFALVIVSAPMLLDPDADVFSATATSVRAVSANPGPTLLWAVILAVVLAITAASGFALMIVTFPWLGLASWHAYRALVGPVPAAAAEPAQAA